MARFERFSQNPRAVSHRAGTPRLSMMDRQIAALRIEREISDRQIRTREELFDDLTNFAFTPTEDEYGLPISTPYQVPDSVPDMLPLPEANKASNSEKKDSVSNEGSGKEPSGGTE